MASINRLRLNTQRISEGAWIVVGADPEDQFEIRTRGATPKYQVRLNELQRAAAAELNRSVQPGGQQYRPDELPDLVAARCWGHAMADETFLDVRGLSNADGSDTTADEFRDMLRHPDEFMPAILLTLGALARVQGERKDEARDAVGNSGNASSGA